MTSGSENKKIFEAILVSAFRDAANLDMEEAELCEPVKLSPAHLKEERRAYNRYEFRRKWRWVTGNQILRRVVAIILVVGCVGFAVLVSMPEVRAAVVDAVVKFRDKYVSLDFTGSGSGIFTSGEYTFGYIPKGFKLTEKYEDPMTKSYEFTNDEGKNICITYSPSFMTILENDIENNDYSEIMINKYKAYLFNSNKLGETKLIFDDGSNVFRIRGEIPEKDVLKVASKISK